MALKLLFTDTQGISLTLNNLHFFRQRLQDVVDKFNELKLGVPMTKELFHSLLTDAEGTVRNIFKDRIPALDQHTGLSIDKESTLKNLVLPNLKPLREAANVANIEKGDGRFLPLFDIGATVCVNDERVNTYLDTKYKYYSDNQAVIKKFNQLNQVGAILNAINAEIPFIQSTNSIVSYDIGQLFRFDTDKQLELKQDGFTHLTMKLK